MTRLHQRTFPLLRCPVTGDTPLGEFELDATGNSVTDANRGELLAMEAGIEAAEGGNLFTGNDWPQDDRTRRRQRHSRLARPLLLHDRRTEDDSGKESRLLG